MTKLQAADFGIVGDGQTDNSAGLRALWDAIRGGGDRAWQIDFDPGHYCYGDNTWALFGDRDVTLRFNHSKVECCSTDPWSSNFGLFPMAGPFGFWGDGPFRLDRVILPPGTLIAAAGPGDRMIRLLADPVDGPPEPGETVLIGGDVQQTVVEPDGTVVGHGVPANLRFFEFKTVAAVPAPDVVQLVEPLRYTYDDNWPDLKHTLVGATVRFYGKPRVWRSRLPGYAMTRALRIEKAHFVGNRNKPATPRRALPRHPARDHRWLHVRGGSRCRQHVQQAMRVPRLPIPVLVRGGQARRAARFRRR